MFGGMESAAHLLSEGLLPFESNTVRVPSAAAAGRKHHLPPSRHLVAWMELMQCKYTISWHKKQTYMVLDGTNVYGARWYKLIWPMILHTYMLLDQCFSTFSQPPYSYLES